MEKANEWKFFKKKISHVRLDVAKRAVSASHTVRIYTQPSKLDRINIRTLGNHRRKDTRVVPTSRRYTYPSTFLDRELRPGAYNRTDLHSVLFPEYFDKIIFFFLLNSQTLPTVILPLKNHRRRTHRSSVTYSSKRTELTTENCPCRRPNTTIQPTWRLS